MNEKQIKLSKKDIECFDELWEEYVCNGDPMTKSAVELRMALINHKIKDERIKTLKVVLKFMTTGDHIVDFIEEASENEIILKEWLEKELRKSD